jgi:hypothetical protein
MGKIIYWIKRTLMITLKIYIYSKNIDLHCVSAFETIKNIRHDTPIQTLKRYRKCELIFDVDTIAKAEAALTVLISSSYDLLNPNKENYYTTLLPTITDKSSYLIEVFKKQSNDDRQLCQRLQKKYPELPLYSLKQSIIWCFLSDKTLSEEDNNNYYTQLVITTTRTSGLFVNPLFETACVYSIQNEPSLSS